MLANEAKLAQVLLNVLINAAQAIPDGYRHANEVHICTFRRDDNVVISVSDTGVGIADDILDRAFDPFFTTKDAIKGTGLGLSISRQILQQFDGRIDIDSSPGAGTTVEITLPVHTG